MNRMPHLLDRLLRAAAQAPQPLPGPLPLSVEARVLARWRAGAPETDFMDFRRLLRIGLGFACAILACAVFYCQLSNRTDFYGAGSFNSAINLTLLQ